MADYGKMKELASENNLETIMITEGMNGYPQNLKPALIGFETFEDAEEFATENGMKTWIFHKRDGWQLWERRTTAYESFIVTSEDYGDDYNMFKTDDLDGYFENEVKPCLGNFDNIEDLKNFLDNQQEIMDKLESCDENEVVITHCGKWYDTVKTNIMRLSNDTHNYVIGVM